MLAVRGGGNSKRMEIRIILHGLEPPAGHLRVVDPGQDRGPEAEQEIRFTGWLGLLRALYEATGTPGGSSRPGQEL